MRGARTIFLARHGERQDADPKWRETAENPLDPDLSAMGIEQARRLARRIAGESIDHLICSPFLRTLHTAHHCAMATGLGIHVENGVAEQREPSWLPSGEYPPFPSLKERAAVFPMIDKGYKSMFTPAEPEPEGHPRICERAAHIIGLLTDRFPGNLLIVTHYAIVNTITLALAGTLINGYIEVSSLTKIEGDSERWRLALSADTAHLRNA